MTGLISEQAGIGLASEHGEHIPGTPYTYYHGWILRGTTSAGTQVTHPEFGTGVIRQKHHNMANGTTADVFFPVTGTRANFEVTSAERDPVDVLGGNETALAKRPTEPDLSPEPDLPSYESTSGFFGEQPLDRNLYGDELEAVDDYVSPEGSEAINTSLRRGGPPRDQYGDVDHDRLAEIRSLDNVISSHTLNKDATVYRGISLSPELERKLQPGKTFTDKAFTSTSSSLTWAARFAEMRSGQHTQGGEGVHLLEAKTVEGKPAIMRITVPAGSHMAPGETDIGEYVLPRKSRFHVDSIESNAMAATMLNVSVLPPKEVSASATAAG